MSQIYEGSSPRHGPNNQKTESRPSSSGRQSLSPNAVGAKKGFSQNRQDTIICGAGVLWCRSEEDFDRIGKVEVFINVSGKLKGTIGIRPIPVKDKNPVRVFEMRQIKVSPFKSLIVMIGTEATEYKLIFESQRNYIRFLCGIEKFKNKRASNLMDVVLNKKLKSRKFCLNALYKYIPPLELRTGIIQKINEALFEILFSTEKIMDIEYLLWTDHCVNVSVSSYVIYLISNEHRFISEELIPRYLERRVPSSIFDFLSSETSEKALKHNKELRAELRGFIRLLFCSTDETLVHSFYEVDNVIKVSTLFENTHSYIEAQKELPIFIKSECDKKKLYNAILALRIASDYPKLIPLDSGDIFMTSICNTGIDKLVGEVMKCIRPYFPEIVSFGKEVAKKNSKLRDKLNFLQFYEEFLGLFCTADATLSPINRNMILEIINPEIVYSVLENIIIDEKEFDKQTMSLIEELLARFLNYKFISVEKVLNLTTKAFLYCIKRKETDTDWKGMAKVFSVNICCTLDSKKEIQRKYIDENSLELATVLAEIDDGSNIPLVVSILCTLARHERTRVLNSLGEAVQTVFNFITKEEPFDVAPTSVQFWILLAGIPKLTDIILQYTGQVIEAICKIEKQGGAYLPKVRELFESIHNASIAISIPPSQEDNANWLVSRSQCYKVLRPIARKICSKRKRSKEFDIFRKRIE